MYEQKIKFQLLACAINASCLALINSGLSMKCTIAAVSCMLDKETGKLIIDPDNLQLKVFINNDNNFFKLN